MSAEQLGTLNEALNQARLLLRKGKYSLALEQVEEIEFLYPEDAKVLFLKSIAKRRLGNYSESTVLLQKLIQKVPDLAAAHQELGLAFFALGRIMQSKKSFQKAVDLDKSLAESWRRLGEIFAAEGQEEASRQAFRNQLATTCRHPLILQAVEAVEEGSLGIAEGICRDYLMRYPTDINAIRLLAEIGLKLGVYGEAEKLLQRCLELAPDFHLARNNYANVLGKSHQFDKALKEIEYLEEVEPDNLSHPVLAASILVNTGDYDGAIHRYEEILAAVPDHSRLQMSFGHALKTVGRQEQSIVAYRKAIQIEPTLGEAYWSLANLKTFRFDDAEVESMRKILRQPELDAVDCFHFCFALAKALEDAGEYDESFEFYANGNEIKKKLGGYDPEANTARVEGIRVQCTSELFGSRPECGNPAIDPIFIVGLPRAGSTLLEQILASHSQVEGTMELPYIAQYARRLGGKEKKSDDSKYPAILYELTDEECRALGQEYLDMTKAQRSGSPFFIDKMPNNFVHVGLIHLILPNAKIIDARRHPMACCFSGFKQLFAAGQEFTYGLDNIGRYYRDYVNMMDHWNKVLPGRVLLVEYEKVVNDLEAQVRRMLAYCGLGFEQSCLEFYASARAVRTASSEQVRQPIYGDAVEQWRNFETHLGPLKQALGPILDRFPM